MTSPFAHTCLCGKRIGVGQRCPVCERQPTEAQRLRNNPNRRSYTSSKYLRNRLVRYELAGGLCEHRGCGVTLKGTLWPQGTPWQCHHITNPVGDRDETVNLRCLCKRHHNRFTT